MASSNSSINELKAAKIYEIATNYQQSYYEINGDWNQYNDNEHVFLKNYIGFALYGPPEYDCMYGKSVDSLYVYKKPGAMDLIDSIYNKIVKHGTQLNENKKVVCSVLYCCVYDHSSLSNYDINKLQESIQIISLFKVKKVKDENEKDTITYQNWFIDTELRVYRSWKDYINNNKLPTCTMIAPKNGVYQADLREMWSDQISPVWVEVYKINTTKEITDLVDMTSIAANLGGIGIDVTSFFNQQSTSLNSACKIGTTLSNLSNLWGGFRAAGELIDRHMHDESISFENEQAKLAWLGLAGSTLGIVARNNSALLSQASIGTSLGKSAQIAQDAIMFSNLFVNCVGAGYRAVTMVQKYCNTGKISTKDIFFLTAHVLFISNSVIEMKLAYDIIKSGKNQILQDYENSFRSYRHRKEFHHLLYNILGKTSELLGNEPIIRSLIKINNCSQFFATVAQNFESLASFAGIQIGGESLIDPSVFASMSKETIRYLISQKSARASTSSSKIHTSVEPKMQQASDKIKLNRNQILQDYENSLRSNAHRKEFRRMVQNTGENAINEIHRNEQVIQSLKKINNRDEFFSKIVQNRKIFASSGTKLSFANGLIQINGGSLIEPSVFSSMSKESIQNLIIQTSTNSSTISSNSNTTPSVSSSKDRDCLSANALKIGMSTVRNFCKQQKIAPPSDVYTIEGYKTIISDLLDFKDSTKILQLLLESGMCMINKMINENYSLEKILQEATNFIWQFVKTNFAYLRPGALMSDSQFQNFVYDLVEKTFDDVSSYVNNWFQAFCLWIKNQLNINQKQDLEFDEEKQKEMLQLFSNYITVHDPVKVMTTKKKLVQDLLKMIDSRMTSTLPRGLVELCEDELKDFFIKNPAKLNMKLTGFSKEFKVILLDLNEFKKKNIIFYKLLVITSNIVQELPKHLTIKKDVFIDIMKYLWIYININLIYHSPDCMNCRSSFESTVIKIIISTYSHQLANPCQWVQGYFQYKNMYGKK